MNTTNPGLLQRLYAQARQKDEADRSILTVLGGHAVSLTLGLASSMMLARSLGVEGLSIFSVIAAALAIATSVSDSGLSNSAVRHVSADLESDPLRARTTAQVFARLKLGGSLLLALLIVALSTPIAALLGLPAAEGPFFVTLAALGLLATAFSGVVSMVLRALRRFSQLVTLQLLNVGLTVALFGALFLLQRLTVANALAVGALTALAAALVGWRLQPAAWRQKPRVHAPLLGPDARRLWRFGRWLWIANMLVVAFSQLDLLLLNHLTNPQETGYYALALNLTLKASVLRQALYTVLLPRASALRGRAQVAAYIRYSLQRSALLCVPLLLLIPLAGPFITTVYGDAFAPALPLFYLLLGVTILEILGEPLLLLAFPLDMSPQIALSHAIRLAALALAATFAIPAFGGAGAALAKIVAYGLSALLLGLLIARRLRRDDLATPSAEL